MKRTLNGVTSYYAYDGEKPILEFFTNGAASGGNVYGNGIDEVLARADYVVNPAGQTDFYQQDHEGSITHLTDASGAVIEKYRYDALGAPTIYNSSNTQLATSNYGNRFLFTGREYANTFGFYEYRSHAYHPGLGRFMSEDPKLFDAGDYNLYRYCYNDPLDMTDPMGLEQFPGIKPPPDPPKKIQTPSNQSSASGYSAGANTGGNFFSRLLRSIANLFGYRQAPVAGESGRIHSSAYGVRITIRQVMAFIREARTVTLLPLWPMEAIDIQRVWLLEKNGWREAIRTATSGKAI